MSKTLTIIRLLMFVAVSRVTAADVVLENARVRVVIGADAQWRSLVDKATSRDYCAADKKIPFANVRVGDRNCPATQASLSDGRLTLKFSGCDTECVYQVTPAPDWIAFQLQLISGARPTGLTLLSVGVTITNRVGTVLNAAWNDQYAICLRGLNLQTHGQAARRRDFVELSASSQDEPGPKLEGSGAALLATPTAELRAALGRLAAAYDLPRNEADGVASRDLPIARQSYWFLNFAENEVDKVIEYCRRTGFRQVMMSSSAWCSQVGHYTFNTTRYPDGVESLRRTVAKLHQAGILVGMHTFSSKISKTDAYVTPVPDRRFVVSRTATLAGDIGSNDTTIRTQTDLSQWPGSPICKQKLWEGHVTKHQEVVIDDEIVYYDRIGPAGKWDTFEGCRRGALKTCAAAHKAGTDCRQYAVDGGINGYIVDLDSTLFDETSSRLAGIFNACGFDMVYFDGSEDVDKRRYSYYSAKAHAVLVRKFTKRPLIHQGGGFVNELWHSFTRDATIDQYPGTYLAHLAWGGTMQKWPTCKDHIERSVSRVLRCADDMMPGELGWFGINPRKGNYDGLQYDEIEYLMAKSLALNAPISLQTGFAQMEAHPLTPDILEIVRVYEELRLSGKTPPQTLAQLGKKGKEFVLLRADTAAPEFIAVQTLPKIAGTNDLRAFVGSHGADAIATLWHYLGKKGKLILNTTQLEVRDVKGNVVPVVKVAGKTTIPVDHRRLTLRFAGVELKAARILLASARFEAQKPVTFWIPATAFQNAAGSMVKSSDAILWSGKIDRSTNAASYCEYRVNIPHKGQWTLWARVRYPTGGDQSFGIVPAGEPITFTGKQVIGNCGLNKGEWHWTGRGGGLTSAPPGVPVTFTLTAGEFSFRIYPREGGGTLATNPQLDCLCLTESPDYVPTDADAKAGLTQRAPQSFHPQPLKPRAAH